MSLLNPTLSTIESSRWQREKNSMIFVQISPSFLPSLFYGCCYCRLLVTESSVSFCPVEARFTVLLLASFVYSACCSAMKILQMSNDVGKFKDTFRLFKKMPGMTTSWVDKSSSRQQCSYCIDTLVLAFEAEYIEIYMLRVLWYSQRNALILDKIVPVWHRSTNMLVAVETEAKLCTLFLTGENLY